MTGVQTCALPILHFLIVKIPDKMTMSRPASAPSPEGGVPGRLAGGLGRNEDRGPGALPSSPPPTPAPGRAGSPRAVRAAAPREGSSGSRVAFAAQILSPAPRVGGRSPEHLGPGRGPWAEGCGQRAPHSHPYSRESGEPGPTWSESEITLFNCTFPSQRDRKSTRLNSSH